MEAKKLRWQKYKIFSFNYIAYYSFKVSGKLKIIVNTNSPYFA